MIFTFDMAILRVFVFLCLCRSGFAQIKTNGSCPQVENMRDFDVNKFLGTWYEVATYYIPYNERLKCLSFDWRLHQNKTVVFVANSTSTLTGIRTCTPYIARTFNPNNQGILSLETTWSPWKNYVTILGTDYDSYAVHYQCKNDESTPTHTLQGWIWARDPKKYESVMDSVGEILKKANYDRQKFMKVNHDDCEVHPASYPPTS